MRVMHRTIFFSFILILASATSTAAQTVRPLSTDRPDRTESPYSVPKGWLQFESDLVSHGEFDFGDETVTGTSIATLNIKYGVTNRLDLQFVFSPFVRLESKRTGLPAEVDEGTGPAGLRAKINLVGNDTGGSAVALLPFALIPTRGDATLDKTTWGIVTPVSMDLGDDRAMSSMLGVMRVNNDDVWFLGSVSVSSPIVGPLAGFVEMFVAVSSFEDDAIEDVTADFGFTYAIAEDWQLDTGVYYGVADTTEDWRLFLGASGRFDLSK